MRGRRFLALVFSFVFLMFGGCTAQPEPRYEIAAYIGSLILKEGSADIDVELDVMYDVFEGVKSDGFKYVGSYEPSHLRGVDETGKPIRVVLRRHRENQIYWTFPGVRGGKKRVVIQFTLRDVLADTGVGRVLSAPWVGIFKVPVKHAEYKVIFPPGFNPKIQNTTPANFERVVANGRVILKLIQEPLTERAISIRFSQGDA